MLHNQAAPNGPWVLLADAVADEREMYAEYLDSRGYRTLQASTADDAHRIAAEVGAAVVVTSVRLEGHDNGLVLIARLRHDALTHRALVIMVSGRVFEDDRLAAERAGCDAFLAKPCLPSTLESAIAHLLPHSIDSVGRCSAAATAPQELNTRHG